MGKEYAMTLKQVSWSKKKFVRILLSVLIVLDLCDVL